MQDLIADLERALAGRGRCVLVTLAQIKGSTPRESGTKMLVWDEGFSGSIGGGSLEYAALAEARRLLGQPPGGPRLERVALGPSLGQCCGGSVTLLMEPLDEGALVWLEPFKAALTEGRPALLVSALQGATIAKTLVQPGAVFGAALTEAVAAAAQRSLARDQAASRIEKDGAGGRYLIEPLPRPAPRLLLFGAGHVGQALAPLLAGLPFQTLWIDERAEIFPAEPPAGVTVLPAEVPLRLVDEAPTASFYLVMTHSHARDLEICERVLQRGDFTYLGLIGSDTKRARFESHFRKVGLTDSRIARLTCPIGIDGITGKAPTEIAVAVAAQLLLYREASAASGQAAPLSASA